MLLLIFNGPFPLPRLLCMVIFIRCGGQAGYKRPEADIIKIGLDGNDGYRLYINKQLLIDNWKKQTYSTALKDFFFDEHASYDIDG